MPGAEGIIFAFGAAGEAGEPALLPKGAHAVATAGQDFVRIGLMANIPDNAVVRGVEYGVQRHGQFDHTKARPEMAAGDRDSVDHFGPQFISKLTQILTRHVTQIGWGLNGVEQRRIGLVGQAYPRQISGLSLFRRRVMPLQCQPGQCGDGSH